MNKLGFLSFVFFPQVICPDDVTNITEWKKSNISLFKFHFSVHSHWSFQFYSVKLLLAVWKKCKSQTPFYTDTTLLVHSFSIFHQTHVPQPSSFWTKVFGVANFAVEFSILICNCGGLEALSTQGTTEAGFMPRLPCPHDLLCCIDRFGTTRTAVWAAKLLCKLAGVGVCGWGTRFRVLGLHVPNRVRTQSSSTLAVSIPFWPIFLAIAGFAVDLWLMCCNSCAVQSFPTGHADEAGLVKAPPIALDLLCMVNCGLTGRTLGPTTPVWHPQIYQRTCRYFSWSQTQVQSPTSP